MRVLDLAGSRDPEGSHRDLMAESVCTELLQGCGGSAHQDPIRSLTDPMQNPRLCSMIEGSSWLLIHCSMEKERAAWGRRWTIC